MTRERSMAASALGGGRGAAVGGAEARRRRRAGVVVGRGSWEAATRIIGRQKELQIRTTADTDTPLLSFCENFAGRKQLSTRAQNVSCVVLGPGALKRQVICLIVIN